MNIDTLQKIAQAVYPDNTIEIIDNDTVWIEPDVKFNPEKSTAQLLDMIEYLISRGFAVQKKLRTKKEIENGVVTYQVADLSFDGKCYAGGTLAEAALTAMEELKLLSLRKSSE